VSIDIRLPIGLFFLLTGIIMTLFGALESPARYQQSLGVNLNLWWGIVLIVFGLIMFLLGRRGKRAAAAAGEPEPGDTTQKH